MFQQYYSLDNGKQAVDYIYEYNLGFSYGNAFKYMVRAGLKPNNSAEKDLNKALVYIMSSDREFPFLKRVALKIRNSRMFNDKTQFAEHHLAEILTSIIKFDYKDKIVRMIIDYMQFRGVEVKTEAGVHLSEKN